MGAELLYLENSNDCDRLFRMAMAGREGPMYRHKYRIKGNMRASTKLYYDGDVANKILGIAQGNRVSISATYESSYAEFISARATIPGLLPKRAAIALISPDAAYRPEFQCLKATIIEEMGDLGEWRPLCMGAT